jgi:hypothetical protein
MPLIIKANNSLKDLEDLSRDLEGDSEGSSEEDSEDSSEPDQESEEENSRFSSGTYQLPILNGEYKEFGGYYTQSEEKLGHPKGHQALDIFAPGTTEAVKSKELSKAMQLGLGEQVFPIGSGIVAQVGSGGKSGNFCVIEHPQDPGMYSFYAHLDKINVAKGVEVSPKTVIGLNGNTGSAKKSAPHVHLEIWITQKGASGPTPMSMPRNKLNPETVIGKSYGSIQKKASNKINNLYKLSCLFELLTQIKK